MITFTLIFIFALMNLSFAQEQAPLTFTCNDIYQKIATSKKESRRISKSTHQVADDMMDVGAWTRDPDLFLIGLLTEVGAIVIESVKSKEEKMLERSQLNSDRLQKFTKKVEKKGKIIASQEEVSKILSAGMKSGDFCRNFPKLYNRNQAIHYVIEKLKQR
jgi:hypothetical protein